MLKMCDWSEMKDSQFLVRSITVDLFYLVGALSSVGVPNFANHGVQHF